METTVHKMTMAEKYAIPIDILSDATSEAQKTYRLWFAIPAEVVVAIRKTGDG